jgi:mRNA-degrading endonuclease YafQ of YafQ-DinJ toxin-antitoxin module
VLVDYAPVQEFNQTLQVLIKQHSKEKENLFKLIEAFQNKVVTLETKLKSTEEKGKSWYRFW